jgi:hypothetical protein
MVNWAVIELYSQTLSLDQPLLSFGPSFFCLVPVSNSDWKPYIFIFMYHVYGEVIFVCLWYSIINVLWWYILRNVIIRIIWTDNSVAFCPNTVATLLETLGDFNIHIVI